MRGANSQLAPAALCQCLLDLWAGAQNGAGTCGRQICKWYWQLQFQLTTRGQYTLTSCLHAQFAKSTQSCYPEDQLAIAVQLQPPGGACALQLKAGRCLTCKLKATASSASWKATVQLSPCRVIQQAAEYAEQPAACPGAPGSACVLMQSSCTAPQRPHMLQWHLRLQAGNRCDNGNNSRQQPLNSPPGP